MITKNTFLILIFDITIICFNLHATTQDKIEIQNSSRDTSIQNSGPEPAITPTLLNLDTSLTVPNNSDLSGTQETVNYPNIVEYANALFEKGDYEKALFKYLEIVDADSTVIYHSPNILINIGFIYHIYKNDTKNSIQYYNEYLQNGGPDVAKTRLLLYSIREKRDPRNIPFLIECLSNEDFIIREGASKYFLEREDNVILPLIKVLHNTIDDRTTLYILTTLYRRTHTIEEYRRLHEFTINCEMKNLDRDIRSGSSWVIPIISAPLFALSVYDYSNHDQHPEWRQGTDLGIMTVSGLMGLGSIISIIELDKNKAKRVRLQKELDSLPSANKDLLINEADFIEQISQGHPNVNIRKAAGNLLMLLLN